MQFNVSDSDFKAGATYISLMEHNVQVLKEALNWYESYNLWECKLFHMKERWRPVYIRPQELKHEHFRSRKRWGKMKAVWLLENVRRFYYTLVKKWRIYIFKSAIFDRAIFLRLCRYFPEDLTALEPESFIRKKIGQMQKIKWNNWNRTEESPATGSVFQDSNTKRILVADVAQVTEYWFGWK